MYNFQKFVLVLSFAGFFTAFSQDASQDEDARFKLYRAILKGNVSDVGSILDEHPNLLNFVSVSDTPLIHAVNMRSLAVLNELLRRGADVNLTNREGKSPLFYAALSAGGGAENSYQILLRLLQEPDIQVNLADQSGITPLMALAMGDSRKYFSDVLEILVEHGADATLKDTQGRSAMYHLIFDKRARSKRIEAVLKLLEVGADCDFTPGDQVYLMTDRDYPATYASYTVGPFPLNITSQTTYTQYLRNDKRIQVMCALINMLSGKTTFNSAEGKDILQILNNYNFDFEIYKMMVNRLKIELEKNANAPQSNCYRNAANLMYVVARNIAGDLVKNYRSSLLQTGGNVSVLPLDIKIDILLKANPKYERLLNLYIVSVNGIPENFVTIVSSHVQSFLDELGDAWLSNLATESACVLL